MKLPDELPEGVSVFIAYPKQIDFWHSQILLSHKINQMRFLKANIDLHGSKKIRLYPVDSKIKYTEVKPYEAWNEGMTLEEFEEYLNG